MARDKFNTNKILNGTYGKVWINGEKFANSKKFEAKITLNYEEVPKPEEPGTGQKYLGHSIAGTIVLNKVDSNVAKMMEAGVKSGNLPEILVISSLEDPAAYGAEKVELSGVTLDEFTLQNWERAAITEEEIPFKAENFRFLDMIEGDN